MDLTLLCYIEWGVKGGRGTGGGEGSKREGGRGGEGGREREGGREERSTAQMCDINIFKAVCIYVYM